MSDQALVPTKVCVRWHQKQRTTNVPLMPLRGQWVCPICQHSYGSHPHPDLYDLNEEERVEP